MNPKDERIANLEEMILIQAKEINRLREKLNEQSWKDDSRRPVYDSYGQYTGMSYD